MYLWEAKEPADAGAAAAVQDLGIKIHHIVAASDDFSKLSMHWDLIPAAKLNYVHDFRGYFNCISQVIYFHNQEYERRPQVNTFWGYAFNGNISPTFIVGFITLTPTIRVECAITDDTLSNIHSGKRRNASGLRRSQVALCWIATTRCQPSRSYRR